MNRYEPSRSWISTRQTPHVQRSDSPHALRRIKKSIPKAKFIILMRNPIDRAYSHYQMEADTGNEELSFEEAIEQEEKRITDDMRKMMTNESFYSVYFY